MNKIKQKIKKGNAQTWVVASLLILGLIVVLIIFVVYLYKQTTMKSINYTTTFENDSFFNDDFDDDWDEEDDVVQPIGRQIEVDPNSSNVYEAELARIINEMDNLAANKNAEIEDNFNQRRQDGFFERQMINFGDEVFILVFSNPNSDPATAIYVREGEDSFEFTKSLVITQLTDGKSAKQHRDEQIATLQEEMVDVPIIPLNDLATQGVYALHLMPPEGKKTEHTILKYIDQADGSVIMYQFGKIYGEDLPPRNELKIMMENDIQSLLAIQ
jgi:hypothetical protein